ncbi:RNA polymerase sigma factor [Granulicella sp. L60]|uniref:RNA polymerase sigma factor n=1 Tax=Granulicella sp. L60 TaxID=1641866 RepID=UPI00131DCEF3|nr:RNA polymerase sigma factor [Granulicella sp. L60]
MSKSEASQRSWRDVFAVYESSWHSVYRRARSIARNHQDAEDATQEAFLRLYEQTESDERRFASPVAWVNTVAKNLILEGFRRAKREDTIDADDATLFEELAYQGETPEESAVAGQETERLRSVLLGLPAIEQQCLSLMAMGWNFRQIANATGLSYHATIDKTRRALRKVGNGIGDDRANP